MGLDLEPPKNIKKIWSQGHHLNSDFLSLNLDPQRVRVVAAGADVLAVDILMVVAAGVNMVTHFLGLNLDLCIYLGKNKVKVVAADADVVTFIFLQGWPRARPWWPWTFYSGGRGHGRGTLCARPLARRPPSHACAAS